MRKRQPTDGDVGTVAGLVKSHIMAHRTSPEFGQTLKSMRQSSRAVRAAVPVPKMYGIFAAFERQIDAFAANLHAELDASGASYVLMQENKLALVADAVQDIKARLRNLSEQLSYKVRDLHYLGPHHVFIKLLRKDLPNESRESCAKNCEAHQRSNYAIIRDQIAQGQQAMTPKTMRRAMRYYFESRWHDDMVAQLRDRWQAFKGQFPGLRPMNAAEVAEIVGMAEALSLQTEIDDGFEVTEATTFDEFARHVRVVKTVTAAQKKELRAIFGGATVGGKQKR